MFVCFGLPETLSLCISGSSGTLFVDQVCLELRSTYPNLNAERKARTTWLGWFVLTWAHWSMLLEVWEDWVSFALVWCYSGGLLGATGFLCCSWSSSSLTSCLISNITDWRMLKLPCISVFFASYHSVIELTFFFMILETIVKCIQIDCITFWKWTIRSFVNILCFVCW